MSLNQSGRKYPIVTKCNVFMYSRVWNKRRVPLLILGLFPVARCLLKGVQWTFLEIVHCWGGFWAHFPGVAVSKCKVPMLLHLWVLFCYTFELLYLMYISLFCYTFEVFTATPVNCLLLHLLSFLFCYTFGLSLLLQLWASATPLNSFTLGSSLFCYS